MGLGSLYDRGGHRGRFRRLWSSDRRGRVKGSESMGSVAVRSSNGIKVKQLRISVQEFDIALDSYREKESLADGHQ